jgi:hypothetical protein
VIVGDALSEAAVLAGERFSENELLFVDLAFGRFGRLAELFAHRQVHGAGILHRRSHDLESIEAGADRIVAAVLAQPSGSRPEMRDVWVYSCAWPFSAHARSSRAFLASRAKLNAVSTGLERGED